MMRWPHFGMLIALWAALLIAPASADPLMIRNGSQQAFAISEVGADVLKAVRSPKAAVMGLPLQGEISVSVSTTHAVGYPKLHVYNRYGKPIMIKGVAMKRGVLLGALELCGHNDTDTWTVLPGATTSVQITHLTALAGDCP